MMKENVPIDRLISYLYSLLNSFVNNAMRDRYLSLFPELMEFSTTVLAWLCRVPANESSSNLTRSELELPFETIQKRRQKLTINGALRLVGDETDGAGGTRLSRNRATPSRPSSPVWSITMLIRNGKLWKNIEKDVETTGKKGRWRKTDNYFVREA